MKPLKIIITLFALFQFGIGTAWAGFCMIKENKVVFANGVFTTKLEATFSKTILKSLTREKLKADNVNLDFNAANEEIGGGVRGADCNGIKFARQYNQTNGTFSDLFEALTQIIIEDTTRIWLIKFGLDIMPDDFRDKIIEFHSGIVEGTLLDTVETQSHVTNYNQYLNNPADLYDYRVIAVSHSQGNLFSNTIYQNLNPGNQWAYKIVSVATPSEFTAGGGPHTTLFTDLVILGISAAKAGLNLPIPRLPNTVPSGVPELSGHSFLTSYLVYGSTSETKIVDDIYNFITVINYGPFEPTCQDGSAPVLINGFYYCNP